MSKSKGASAGEKIPEGVLVRLQDAQTASGCSSPEVMTEIAESMGLPVNDVYGVTTFYSFLSTRKLGRNVIRICKSLPCYLRNCQVIIDTVRQEIGIKPGQTTPDGRFFFELTNCIGLCDRAPAMLINNDAHVDLTPEKISQILQTYK